ncbi:MAG: hypothetical protein M3401_02385 [Actinomycetota bacterium]|nr:hypothetical protein [Actinomycetota bacterium]
MATPRIVDPRLFVIEAGLIDWLSEARRQKARIDVEGAPVVVALRWHINGASGNPGGPGGKDRGIGLPTGPFTVWRRHSFAGQAEKPVGFTTTNMFLVTGRLVLFDEPVAMARLSVDSVSGGPINGLASAPEFWSIATTSHAPAGPTQVELHGPYLNGAVIPSAMSLSGVSGIAVAEYEALPGWEEVEIVGLPVDPSEWGPINDHGAAQGPVSGLMDPRDAAVDRIKRGTPPFGWPVEVQPGVAAPVWETPEPSALVDEVGVDVLPALRAVLSLDQMSQAAERMTVSVPPPQTLDGEQMNAPDGTAEVSPMMLLRAATGSDPFLSLALGYGTNLTEDDNSDAKPYHDGSLWDFMVTAPYARGLDGQSDAVELAAYALRPPRALPPFPASQLVSEDRAHLAPPSRDIDWGTSAIVRWSRPPKNALVRVASYAAGRHDQGAAESRPLMDKRPSGGHKPVAPGVGGGDPELNWVHLADRYLRIPNDPGSRQVRYSIATQSLFSLWSPWLGVDYVAAQPSTPPPRVVAARLAVTAPPILFSKVCDGTLTVDVAWDWTDRSPAEVILVGRVYASPDQATPPPVASAPGGLERAINSPGAAVVMTFAGDAATITGAPGHVLTYLNAGGDAAVAVGAQGDGVRRYRITIPGSTADFGSTPHIGIALWTRAIERLAPGHETVAAGPTIVYASDPVAPPVPPEIVPLASLPDGAGQSHARISWPAVPGAAGYSVYTSDEVTMLAHYGEPEPAAADTLSDRADALLDLWEANPDRRPFTRLTASALTSTSLDVSMPKGATGIHAYVIVSTSPGQVEGPWPSGPNVRDQVILRAAPRIAAPTAPMIEGTAKPDGTVDLRVTTRPGHRADRVDIYRVRVDDAARSLDTMGPPIARVGLATPGWSVTTAPDGRPERFAGSDVPGSSWRRVWYRAVAWAAWEWPVMGELPHQIAEQGLISGRSQPSNAISVVTPPPGNPDLSDLEVTWPGGAVADIQIGWSTLAPLLATALGTHRLEVVAVVVGDPAASSLIDYGGDLGTTPLVAPATGDGLWRAGAGPPAPSSFRALIRRTSADVSLDVLVRIADPMGRISQRTLRVPGGPVLPDPELADIDLVPLISDLALNFTSGAPAGVFGGVPYTLKISAVQAGSGSLFPFLDAVSDKPQFIRPGALKPTVPIVAEAARPDAEIQPVRKTFALPVDRRPPLRPKVHTLELAIGDIPIDAGQPPSAAPLQIRRRKGSGRRGAYAVLARVEVTKFSLRLTAPDGRSFSIDVDVP